MVLQRILTRFAPASAQDALAAPLRFPSWQRRALNREDYRFAAMVGGGFVASSLIFSLTIFASHEARPSVLQLRARLARLAPDLWLAVEQLLGREGEVSEAVRRQNAFEQGRAYAPVVTPPPAVAPSAEDVARLVRRPHSGGPPRERGEGSAEASAQR